MRDLQELLDLFPAGKWQGNTYVTRCPICGDRHRHNHLNITATGNKVKIHCMMPECNANGADVMAALGKPVSFLYLDDGKPAAITDPAPYAKDQKTRKVYPEIMDRAKCGKDTWLKIARKHEYKDVTGRTVFIKAVYKSQNSSEKTCRWFTPTQGGYFMGTGGGLVPLYNSDVLDQYTGSTVYVVEGEKDCDTMWRKMGLMAVSAPNGGSQVSWDDSYSEALRCRDVVIITDNDDVGTKYGKTVAAHLDGIAQSIKIIPAASIYPDLDEKGDITDIYNTLDKEATICRLQAAEDQQKHSATDLLFQLGAYTMDELTPEDLQPPEFIVDGMIPVGMTFLSGAPKTRKSFLSLQLAEAVAQGNDFLGHKTKQCSVLYFDLEGNKNRLAARTRSMGVQLPPTVHVLNEVPAKLAGDGEENLVALIKKIHKQHPEIRLVIIDTYSRARGTVKCNGSNAYDMDVQFLEPVQRMAQNEKIALMFVHHDRKGANMNGDSLERLSGTMGISGSADSVLTLVSEGKRFEGKATLEYNPRDAQGGQMELVFDDATTQWEQFKPSTDSIENCPMALYLLNNHPSAGAQGQFYAWDDFVALTLHTNAAGTSDRLVRDALNPHRANLYIKYGIGLQWPVKTNGKRGFRVYYTSCPPCPPN